MVFMPFQNGFYHGNREDMHFDNTLRRGESAEYFKNE